MQLEKDILEIIKNMSTKTSTYEMAMEQLPNTTYISIDSMNVNQLISRLPFYKTLYLKELRKNSNELYEKLLKEYEL